MTAPFYQDDTITLYQGDAREVIAWLGADVLITDPPYGSQQLSPTNGNRGGYGRRDLREPDQATSGRRFIANDDTTAVRDQLLAMWGADRPRLVFGSPRTVSIIEAHPERLEQAYHIHAKPLALMLRLVAAAPPGVVADPCAGGGGTLVACKQLGVRAIGVELDEQHCAHIVARLSQDSLFEALG